MQIDLNISLSWEGNISLTSLANGIEKLELNKAAMKAVLEKEQEKIVDEKKNQGWIKNGSKWRILATRFGKMRVKVQRMKKGNRTCMPLLGMLGMDGSERYSRDIKMECADTALKLSYRDSEEEVSKRGIRVSKSRIHSFVQEIGHIVKEENDSSMNNHNLVMGDGTKTHGIGRKNEVNVVIGIRDGKKDLLGVTVNKSWEYTGKEANKHIADNASLVSDAEEDIRNAIKNAEFQMDMRHVITTVNNKLWWHKVPREDREPILTELKRILYTLKNSVKKHAGDKDMGRLQWRIETTLRDLKALAKRAERMGYWRVTRFIQNSANKMVTFARLLIAGTRIPHTSNMIERLMGEIAKRVKNKWAHWSAKGLENLLSMLLVRYCSREKYKNIWNKYVYGGRKNICMKAKITIGGTISTRFGT